MAVNIKIRGIAEGHSLESVIEQVAIHYKRDTDEFKKGLRDAIAAPELAKPLMQDLDDEEADRACELLAGFGLLCEKEETFSLELAEIEKMQRCPACGHEQKAAEDGNDICESCGVVASKYNNSARQKILEEEKHRLALKQRHAAVQAEKEQAEREEEAIREEIQAQLGVKRKSIGRKPLIGIGAVVSLAAIATISQLDAIKAMRNPQKPVETAQASAPEKARPRRISMAKLQAAASLAAQKAAEQRPPLQGDARRLDEIQTLLEIPAAPSGTAQTGKTATANAALPPLSESASYEHFSQAFDEAEKIRDPKQKAVALDLIVDRALNQKHSAKTLTLFEKKFRGFGVGKTPALGDKIVTAWLESGDSAHAFKTAAEMRNPFQRAEAIRKVFLWEIEHNSAPDFKTSRKLLDEAVGKIRSPYEKAKVLSTISRLYQIEGDSKQSERYLEKAFDQSDLALQIDHKIDALNRIAVDRIAVDDSELGLQIFDNITELASGLSKYNPAKSRSFAIIARGQAQSGNYIDAKKSILEIQDDEIRADILGQVAEMAIRDNKPDIASVFLEMRNENVLVGGL